VYIGGEPTLGYPAAMRDYRATNVAHRETSAERSDYGLEAGVSLFVGTAWQLRAISV